MDLIEIVIGVVIGAVILLSYLIREAPAASGCWKAVYYLLIVPLAVLIAVVCALAVACLALLALS